MKRGHGCRHRETLRSTASYLLVDPRDRLGNVLRLQGVKLVVRARVVVTENLEGYLQEEATRALRRGKGKVLRRG